MRHILFFLWMVVAVPSLCNAQEQTIKVISYNIWNGFDFGKDEKRRTELTTWVNQQNPQIVGLQELCNYTPEKLQEDAKKWGHNHSVLLKQTGYSVGLSSEFPIEVKEEIFEGMHHGALHCRTAGIDIFVIHFSPFSYTKRREEARIILDKLAKISNNPKYLVMGDFNALSPFDADTYKNGILEANYRRSEDPEKDRINLADGKLDYSVLSGFLAFPLLDVCQYFTQGMEQRGSFPARILNADSQLSTAEMIERLQRIDYILVSPELAKSCTMAKVCNGPANHLLSDHYPVMALFTVK